MTYKFVSELTRDIYFLELFINKGLDSISKANFGKNVFNVIIQVGLFIYYIFLITSTNKMKLI